MYVKVKDRTIAGPLPTSTDPNGTLLYDGTYKTHINLLGISASTKF
jgi:hypothetical protein